ACRVLNDRSNPCDPSASLKVGSPRTFESSFRDTVPEAVALAARLGVTPHTDTQPAELHLVIDKILDEARVHPVHERAPVARELQQIRQPVRRCTHVRPPEACHTSRLSFDSRSQV